MTDETLFDGYEPPTAPDTSKRDELSAGRRLTLRQKTDVANGRHPLTGTRLHPQATRHATADDGPNNPFTCGTCIFRHQLGGAHDGRYPKCLWPDRQPDEHRTPSMPTAQRWPRISNGPATDVRAWWPACPSYEAKP